MVRTRQYSISEAKNRLPALVHDAEKGASVELTRRGRPVAVLVSLRRLDQLERKVPDLWEALMAFRSRHRLGGVAKALIGLRDRSPGPDGARW